MDYAPRILWQDENLLVIDKPPGLLCLPDGYDRSLTHVRQILEPEWGPLWIVHRLDKETSGVLLLARNAAAHRNLSEQFSRHSVTKRYHALVCGDLDWELKEVNIPLRSQVGRRKRTIADPQVGKSAVTIFQQLENFGAEALVEARPLTGRTHQIRAHLYTIHCSILSDPLYGPAKQDLPLRLSRMALHALEIGLQHPVNHKITVFAAPYPDDFSNALEALRRAAHPPGA